jgi:hypothetical protein
MLRNFRVLPIAAASVLTALTVADMASAEDKNRANLGPVGPNEPILATFGDKRVIAYYEPDGDTCEVSAIVFDMSPNGGGEASTRVRLDLHQGEILNLDTMGDRRVMLTCGPNASMLTVLNRGELRTKSARNVIY